MTFKEVKLEIPGKLNLSDSLGIIDLQPTFIEGGELAVAGSKEIIDGCISLADYFTEQKAYLWACEDAHELGSVSLASSYVELNPFSHITYEDVLSWTGKEISKNAKFDLKSLENYLKDVKVQVLWPDHAIIGTKNSLVLKEIRQHNKLGTLIRKGFNISEKYNLAPDSYSACRMNTGEPTGLLSLLKERGIKRVFLCGLAGDYCVGSTAKDLLNDGFEVWMVVDLQACVSEESEKLMVEDLLERGCKFCKSADILSK